MFGEGAEFLGEFVEVCGIDVVLDGADGDAGAGLAVGVGFAGEDDSLAAADDGFDGLDGHGGVGAVEVEAVAGADLGLGTVGEDVVSGTALGGAFGIAAGVGLEICEVGAHGDHGGGALLGDDVDSGAIAFAQVGDFGSDGEEGAGGGFGRGLVVDLGGCLFALGGAFAGALLNAFGRLGGAENIGGVGEFFLGGDGAAVDFHEEIIGFEAGFFGGGIGEDGNDHQALIFVQLQLFGDDGGDVFDGDAEPVLIFGQGGFEGGALFELGGRLGVSAGAEKGAEQGAEKGGSQEEVGSGSRHVLTVPILLPANAGKGVYGNDHGTALAIGLNHEGLAGGQSVLRVGGHEHGGGDGVAAFVRDGDIDADHLGHADDGTGEVGGDHGVIGGGSYGAVGEAIPGGEGGDGGDEQAGGEGAGADFPEGFLREDVGVGGLEGGVFQAIVGGALGNGQRGGGYEDVAGGAFFGLAFEEANGEGSPEAGLTFEVAQQFLALGFGEFFIDEEIDLHFELHGGIHEGFCGLIERVHFCVLIHGYTSG